ncbi:MAG TPA: alpha/beta hydrolase [Solirubrobacterales bacterium]|nr:alpha/beta hydrolase [Solirubrobacterales bacterium]
MGRLLKIILLVAVVLVALAVVNAIVLGSQTKPASVTADGGRIESASSADLQVFDSPATGPGPEGAPLVLLHCLGCSSQWWNPNLPELNERHRVVRIDLIGHGGSEKPQSGYEIESQGAAVAAVLNSLGVQGATVVGHSLGGMVATSLAEQASQLVDRLIMIGVPSEAGEASFPLTEKLLGTPVVGQALWRVRLDSMIKDGYGSAFAPGTDVSDVFPGDPDRVVEDNRAMTYDSFTQARDAADDYLEAQPVASRVTTTGVPLMWIDGSEDQIIDAAAVAEEFEAVPGAITKLIDGVGHSPAAEAPEETTKLILDFAGVGSAAGPGAGGGQSGTPDGGG